MKTKKNKSALQRLRNLYSRIINSGVLNIKRTNLLFKPWRKTSVFISKSWNTKIGKDKYWHRPFTHPVTEKQTLIKNDKKTKHAL